MTDTKRIIDVEVQSWDGAFAVPVLEFIDELRALTLDVPEEHRSQVKLKFDPKSDDDYPCGEISLYYQREETDEEVAARQQADEQRRLLSEDRELAHLEYLKRKYEKRLTGKLPD